MVMMLIGLLGRREQGCCGNYRTSELFREGGVRRKRFLLDPAPKIDRLASLAWKRVRRYKRRRKLRALGLADNPKTDIAVAIAGIVVVAIRGTANPRIEVPRTAANDSPRFFVLGQPSTAVNWCAFIIVVPMVKAPFPDVAVQVTQSEGIG